MYQNFKLKEEKYKENNIKAAIITVIPEYFHSVGSIYCP